MKDVSQGLLLFSLSILAMIAYFWALFLAPRDIIFLDRTILEWALIIPVLIFVYLFLFVVAWIGWTMATTPPPLPVSGKGEKSKEESEAEENENG